MKLKIRIKDLKSLAKLQCSEAEAAGFFGISTSRFKKFLQEYVDAKRAWDSGREEGKIGLRRKQFRLAGENASMAIFLGKQYLGQNDVSVTEHSGRNGGPIESRDLSLLSKDKRKELRNLLKECRG